jgi:hypothetical protein
VERFLTQKLEMEKQLQQLHAHLLHLSNLVFISMKESHWWILRLQIVPLKKEKMLPLLT